MIETQDWGIIDYDDAWKEQIKLVKEIQQNRNRSILVFCEHPTVITIGRNGDNSNLLLSEDLLKNQGINVVYNDRGGDITLHNQGQLIGYPIFNLSDYKQDLHWFLRQIENCIIELLSGYGIESKRKESFTGVYINGNKKICSIGLHCSRWVTSHGFALNINNNLTEFSFINPCELKNIEMASIEKETGIKVDMNKVKEECIAIFENMFKIK